MHSPSKNLEHARDARNFYAKYGGKPMYEAGRAAINTAVSSVVVARITQTLCARVGRYEIIDYGPAGFSVYDPEKKFTSRFGIMASRSSLIEALVEARRLMGW